MYLSEICWGAVIVSAGQGSRFGGDVPKQFALLGGKSVLDYSIKAFKPMVNHLVVVTPPGEEWRKWWTAPAEIDTIPGGSRRQDSVMNGLLYLLPKGVTHVLVHDAARPLVDTDCIRRVMDAAEVNPAVVPGIKVRDTVKRISGDTVTDTLDRDSLRLIQTPQGFNMKRLVSVLSGAGDITDEAGAFEALGEKVIVVQGSLRNIKLTDREDGEMVSHFMNRPTRVLGTGLDFHPFHTARPLIFCGCRLGETNGLDGHSDGDVVLHAVCDSLLSAARLGDIGTFFPPGDSKWKNADSSHLLSVCVKMVRSSGWNIMRIDVTVIGESPVIAPVREMLISRLAEIAAVPPERIWIKGTTTNTIGELAQGKGVACSVLSELERVSE
jgi:2-C-methyl-D-erythritol 4-phosphate cytidylyltransferase/2-C-methyl-D-erythritol 2,4-cyclodiphosphate synthase